MKSDRFYLLHIDESLQWIETFVQEGYEEFLASRKTQDAVIRNFEIIGEATKQLSPELTAAHPEIPWRRIAGFRDVLIHNYMGVDLDEVWNVAVQMVGQLRKHIRRILEDAERG